MPKTWKGRWIPSTQKVESALKVISKVPFEWFEWASYHPDKEKKVGHLLQHPLWKCPHVAKALGWQAGELSHLEMEQRKVDLSVSEIDIDERT